MRNIFILGLLCTSSIEAHVTKGIGDTYTVDSHGASWDMDSDRDFKKSPYDSTQGL